MLTFLEDTTHATATISRIYRWGMERVTGWWNLVQANLGDSVWELEKEPKEKLDWEPEKEEKEKKEKKEEDDVLFEEQPEQEKDGEVDRAQIHAPEGEDLEDVEGVGKAEEEGQEEEQEAEEEAEEELERVLSPAR